MSYIVPKVGLTALSGHDLEQKRLSVANVDFSDFCDPISHMLGAESVNDLKIKVVPYSKYYNFALVISSMQGL